MPYASLFGAILIGGVTTAILYGITCLQCFNYFQRNMQEPTSLKASVWMLWLLSTCHFVIISMTLYTQLVDNFGNLSTLSEIQWSTPPLVIITVCISLLVQCWNCHRVWILSEKNAMLTYPLLFVTASAFCWGAAAFLQLALSNSLAEFRSKQWISYIAVACVTTADVYIAVALCYFLVKHRRGVMPQTHSFVGMLLVYTVSTGMLTSVVAVGYVITSLLWPRTYVWWAIYFVLGEVYASSFMAWLNAREHFRRTLEHRSYSPAIHVTSVRFAETMLFMDHGLDSDSQATCEDSTCDQDTLAWSDKTETQYGGFFASSQTFHSRRTRRRRSL